MGRVRRFSVSTVLAISLVASSPLWAGDYMDKNKKDRSGVLEPTGDRAVVCVVRKTMMGAAIRFWTFMDEEPLGITRGKSQFCASVEGGHHRFWSKAENVSVLDLEIEPGRTYFLQNVVRVGVGKARVKLVELDRVTGRRLVEKLPSTVLTEDGKARGREISARKYARVLEKGDRS